MKESIVDARFVYVSRLWIIYLEVLVPAMTIGTTRQVTMKREYIRHQMPPKRLYIRSLAFAAFKFPPRVEQILDRNGIVVSKIP